jgi:hypothetical protein
MSFDDIVAFSPNTNTCPKFFSARDFRLARSCYERFSPLIRVNPPHNRWRLSIDRYINVSDFSEFLKTMRDFEGTCRHTFDSTKDFAPTLEGKLFHQYDHRFSTYSLSARDLDAVPLTEKAPDNEICMGVFVPVEIALRRNPVLAVSTGLLAVRDIARRKDERSVIAAVVPPNISDYTVRVFVTDESGTNVLLLLATLNSFIFDFLARQRLGGTHLSNYVLEQVPCCAPNDFKCEQASFIVSRALELTFTSRTLEAFAHQCGYDGPPFYWDEDRRFVMRCEMDAFYFHLYGMPMYVGKGLIASRVRGHAMKRSSKNKYWDHFTWFVIKKSGYEGELEVILLRTLPFYVRSLNRQTGSLQRMESC